MGKGSQCALLAEEFGFHHISVGDLLREEAKRPTSPYRDFIPESIKKSIVIPAQLTTELLNQAMSKVQAQGKHKFLLDGFPRSVAQAVDFESRVCLFRADEIVNQPLTISDLQRLCDTLIGLHRGRVTSSLTASFYAVRTDR